MPSKLGITRVPEVYRLHKGVVIVPVIGLRDRLLHRIKMTANWKRGTICPKVRGLGRTITKTYLPKNKYPNLRSRLEK
jgi:hypothetical protein